ncbi:hypothetical protein QP166_13225 [Sphingomonas sp. LR60]|uniref:hypothetical protein n=1 Tax=Sphingomonas sp. LR60 TaxID=3050233 RepID=UPI002FDF4562
MLLLAGCGKIGAPAFASDPQMVGLNAALAAQAQSFYDALPAKTAPECGYAANEPGYAAMQQQATAIATRAAVDPRDASLRRAADALRRTIDGAAESHRRASAQTDGRFGLCMAPAAIALDADAVARATTAVADLERARGDR